MNFRYEILKGHVRYLLFNFTCILLFAKRKGSRGAYVVVLMFVRVLYTQWHITFIFDYFSRC